MASLVTRRYGQTGSGKTWTMTGDVNSEENQGITPRAMKQLFGEIEELEKKGVSEIKVSPTQPTSERPRPQTNSRSLR